MSYTDQVSDPRLWVQSAEALLESAARLEPSLEEYWTNIAALHRSPADYKQMPDCTRVYLMLVAYALENLFKAALVQKSPQSFRDEANSNGKLPARLKSHGLPGLAKDVGISRTIEDEEWFLRLVRNSVWAGRYPVPKSEHGMDPTARLSDGSLGVPGLKSSEDVYKLKVLVDKVRTELGL